jgi:hypothetical protein
MRFRAWLCGGAPSRFADRSTGSHGTSVAAGVAGGVTVLVRIGSLLAVILIVLVTWWVRASGPPLNVAASGIAPVLERSSSPEATRSDAAMMTSRSRRDEDVDDTVDLYGNEIKAAVATYKLDRTGALYELHSPETEVPQLPPPKS